jgi:hypothetical protein
MMHLLAFKPIAAHISFNVEKLFAVRMSESRGNAAVAALGLAARFLDAEVDAPPPPPPPLLPPWLGVGAF